MVASKGGWKPQAFVLAILLCHFRAVDLSSDGLASVDSLIILQKAGPVVRIRVRSVNEVVGAGLFPSEADAKSNEVPETEIHVSRIRLSSMSSFAVSLSIRAALLPVCACSASCAHHPGFLAGRFSIKHLIFCDPGIANVADSYASQL